MTAFENKIPNVNNLVKKSDYDTKVDENKKLNTDHKHYKYITTPGFKTAGNLAVRLEQVNLVTDTDFDDKQINPNKKVTSDKTKHLLVENQKKKRNI